MNWSATWRRILNAAASSTGTRAILNSCRTGHQGRAFDHTETPCWRLLVMARKLAHTQMLCSFVAERG